MTEDILTFLAEACLFARRGEWDQALIAARNAEALIEELCPPDEDP